MADSTAPVRRRVTQACETCRALKSRCNGAKPVCNRCKGYGYKCTWRARPVRRAGVDADQPTPPTHAHYPEDLSHLRQQVAGLRGLLSQLRDGANPSEQESIDLALSEAAISSQPRARDSPPSISPSYPALLAASVTANHTQISSQRYLGKVSDVSFFNSVRDIISNDSGQLPQPSPMESYERDAADSNDALEHHKGLDVPDREISDKFIATYFATIHVAYPFLCRPSFMHEYELFWQDATASSSWFRPTLLTLLAVGSYYHISALSTSEQTTALHPGYFRHAVLSACHSISERSIENVQVLLLQCFYLLTTCQTDRAWMTLGLAIRIGQSIGLHVEDTQAPVRQGMEVPKEFRRRTWHSAFVLDRLLSLQLGRPSAIQSQDCTTALPSRMGDEDIDVEEDHVPSINDGQPQSGDYFLAMIDFSEVVGHVIADLSRPNMLEYSEALLCKTERLDAELLLWRARLPRWLRFDRGHPFENSSMLKRQRNMLGMKFHHLRALINRPYLCLPWLTQNDESIKQLLETQIHRVVQSERICVEEAQATAHMLHNVTDKKSLVEDFPWWQIISCLVCASSILMVMRAFSSPAALKNSLQQEVLEEDADTCLTVFDALSTNSDAARLARDMLRKLRHGKIQDLSSLIADDLPSPGDGHQLFASEPHTSNPSMSTAPKGIEEIGAPGTGNSQSDDPLLFNPPSWNWQDWPSEIADSMTWSARFFDTMEPSQL